MVEADFASAGKPESGDGTPSCFFDLRTAYALFAECCNFGVQIVAHWIVIVAVIVSAGMDC